MRFGVGDYLLYLPDGGWGRDVRGLRTADFVMGYGVCRQQGRIFVAGPVVYGFESAYFVGDGGFCDSDAHNSGLGLFPANVCFSDRVERPFSDVFVQVIRGEQIGLESPEVFGQDFKFIDIICGGGAADRVIDDIGRDEFPDREKVRRSFPLVRPHSVVVLPGLGHGNISAPERDPLLFPVLGVEDNKYPAVGFYLDTHLFTSGELLFLWYVNVCYLVVALKHDLVSGIIIPYL